jgi:hypothetical protein
LADLGKLTPEELDKIVRLLGYGRPSAPVWFIGMEEGLGGMNSEDTSMNLRSRCSFAETMDLRQAHLLLRQKGIPIDVETNLPSTSVWRFMAKIMLARSGDKNWKDREETKNYVRFRLGRQNEETFLTELSPIPSRKTGDKQRMISFGARVPDLAGKLDRRRAKLTELLRMSNPRLVVCYGLRRVDDFEQLMRTKLSSRATKIYASDDNGRLLLPFFGCGQMSLIVIEDLLRMGLLGQG